MKEQIKLELAKAALMGGLGVEYARMAYEWVCKDDELNLDKIPVAEIGAELGSMRVRFLNRCEEAGIKTIGDLVRYGQHGFRNMRFVGIGLVYAIGEALANKYKVTTW